MKTLRYLLIAFAAMTVLSVSAQSMAQQPGTEFHSTSSMVGSGSTLPQAAQSGAYTTYDMNGEISRGNGGIKRGLDDDDEGEITIPDDNADIDATPIGDAAIPLALCALAYLIIRVARRRKRV